MMQPDGFEIRRHGMILNTGNYRQCVAFYRDILGLPVLFERHGSEECLTCFEIGGAYLMVEPGGLAEPGAKPATRCPSKLRFNIADVDSGCAHLRRHGVLVEMRRHSWGATAEFCDPDGNRCALRSAGDFSG